jgi:DNA-binding NarL/FixJ family response regulator
VAIRVYVVEDHPVMRDTLVEYLGLDDELEICGTAADAGEALAGLEEADPAVILLDLSLPGTSGLDLLAEIRERWGEVPCVILSGHKEQNHLRRAFQRGARGYLLKGHPDEIRVAIHRVLEGKVYVAEVLRDEMVEGEPGG